MTGKMELKYSLYSEHLECISMLYEQRLGMLRNKNHRWLRAADIEERIETHIDALVLGRDDALSVCKKQSIEGDFGELYGAVAVFCRVNRRDLVEDIVQALDSSDPSRLNAVNDSLCHELPESLLGELLEQLAGMEPHHLLIAASVAGYRRFDLASSLCLRLKETEGEKEIHLSILSNLGRIRNSNAADQVKASLNNRDRDVVEESLKTLLKICKPTAANKLFADIPETDWPAVPLGLYGGRESLEHIAFHGTDTKGSTITPEESHILAAGVLGNINYVERLIISLEDNETAENAALALTLITGAELFEEIFIPEEIDEESLFDHERERHRKGELFPPGSEPGIIQTRISQKPEHWRNWWEHHKSGFDPGIRYRAGKPYSPEILLDTIMSEKSPEITRRLSAEELVIRYDIDTAFETSMPVMRQKEAIERFRILISDRLDRFEPGKWYINGQLIHEQPESSKHRDSMEIKR